MRERLSILPGHSGIVSRCRNSAGMERPHSHDEYEFNLVTGGSAHYVVDGSRYLIVPGTIIWLFPEQDHLIVDYSNDFRMWVVVFSRSVARETQVLPELVPEGQGVFCRRLPQTDTDALYLLCSVVSDRSGAASAFNHGLSFLCDTAWRYSHAGELQLPVEDLSPLVTAAIRALGETCGNLSLEETAARFNASASWLGRSFVRETGVSFVRYRNQLKLAEFLRLRRSRPHAPLAELALSAGFGSYVQFARVYRGVYGHAPTKAAQSDDGEPSGGAG